MKLSEIKGERVLDVTAEIIGPICELATDDSIKHIFQPVEEDDKRTALIRRVGENVPELLRRHKTAIVQILAALEMQTPEEYLQSMTLPGLINGISEAITDDCFMDLFLSAQTRTSGK